MIGAHVPPPGVLNLDHVAHFVPDSDAASAALEQLGFTLTPFSPQSHRLQPGGPLVPAGTANRCVMLESGYVEFLTPTGHTPIADQLRAGIQRYIGVHLVAFGTSAPDADHERLAREGFDPLAPVALQRPISTATGEQTARFTVVRVPPGRMPEGRIQFCQHHTPELVWQSRWLQHRNGAVALAAVILCVADPQEAAERFSRFSGLSRTTEASGWTIETSRGALMFVDAAGVKRMLGLERPTIPWIAGYVIDCSDVAVARTALQRAGFAPRPLSNGPVLVHLPEVLGGAIVFQAAGNAGLRLG